MRLQHPFEIITPTLDGDVLMVLAGGEDWFGVSTINDLIPQRSDEGIRKTLKRLVSVGIAEELTAGRSHLYRLNREHLGAELIIHLASLKHTFLSQIHAVISSWEIKPIFVALFGSAARGEMETGSDIDLFVIQPNGTSDSLWERHVTGLAEQATKWIGSDVRPLVYTESEISQSAGTQTVLDDIADEGIPVFGTQQSLRELLKPSYLT